MQLVGDVVPPVLSSVLRNRPGGNRWVRGGTSCGGCGGSGSRENTVEKHGNDVVFTFEVYCKSIQLDAHTTKSIQL